MIGQRIRGLKRNNDELWDKMKIGGGRKVEVTTNEDGMEVIIGEIMVPTFYFTNEKKFWC